MSKETFFSKNTKKLKRRCPECKGLPETPGSPEFLHHPDCPIYNDVNNVKTVGLYSDEDSDPENNPQVKKSFFSSILTFFFESKNIFKVFGQMPKKVPFGTPANFVQAVRKTLFLKLFVKFSLTKATTRVFRVGKAGMALHLRKLQEGSAKACKETIAQETPRIGPRRILTPDSSRTQVRAAQDLILKVVLKK